jgi:hypothetical protein
MRFTRYSFGSVQVDGVTYDHDLIIDRGKIASERKPFPGSSVTHTDQVSTGGPWRTRVIASRGLPRHQPSASIHQVSPASR